MPDRMEPDRETPGGGAPTGRMATAAKSSALADRLAAAPRAPKNSLARFIRENAQTIRDSRDEGVSWEAIVAAVRENFGDAAQTSIETYLARFASAKATRKQRENEAQEKEASARPLERPSVPAAAGIVKKTLPGRQTASTDNPFLPRRPSPKDL